MKYFIAIVLLASQALPAMAEANAVHSSDTQAVNLVIQSPCVGAEEVKINASLKINSQVTITPSGGYHTSSLLHMSAKGFGLSSGDEYLVNQIILDELNSKIGPSYEFSFVTRFMIIRPGKGGDYKANALVHYTIGQDGNIRAWVDNSRFECN